MSKGNPTKRKGIGLSELEQSQLGLPATKTQRYISEQDWPLLRQDIVKRRQGISSDKFPLDPELTAYTPGETLGLLEHPVVKEWHDKMLKYKIPEIYKTIILVPCAVTKPWGAQHCQKSTYYKAYHAVKKDADDGIIPGPLFFVTLSEPLGVVPEDMWDNFPIYDNPGLFKNTPQRSGLLNEDWAASQFKEPHKMPFDPKAKDIALNKLSDVIASFISNNKADGRRFISFVDYRAGSGKATHSAMLDKAQEKLGEAVATGADRLPKNERGYQREDGPKGRGLHSYMRDSLKSLLDPEVETVEPEPDEAGFPPLEGQALAALEGWLKRSGFSREANYIFRIAKNAALINNLSKEIDKDRAGQMESLEERYFSSGYAQDAADILDDLGQPGAAGVAYVDDKTNQIGGYLYGYELVFEDELSGEGVDAEDFDCFDEDCAKDPSLFAEEMTQLAKDGGIFYVSNFLVDKPYRMRVNDLIFGLLAEVKRRGYSYMAFDALSDTYRLIMKDNMPNKSREERYNIKVLGRVDQGTSLFLARIN